VEAPVERVKRKYTKRAKQAATSEPVQKKAKVAKAKVAKVAKHKAISGQSGPRIKELAWDDLNKKEKILLGCFELKGDRETRTIEALAAEAFKTVSAKKANSHVRNSLRRLIRGDLLEKPEPGSYRLSVLGRKIVKS
jgi:hypothetical protein